MTTPTGAPWYQDLVISEIYVRGIYDPDGGGTDGAALPPVAGDQDLLTPAPHSFCWLRLESR